MIVIKDDSNDNIDDYNKGDCKNSDGNDNNDDRKNKTKK